MGSPPRMKKHYDTPRRPWDKEKLEGDKDLLKKYGLRRKQEIYRAETIVRTIRRRARKLFAERDEKKEAILFKKTYDMGITEANTTLDRVLDLKTEGLLERRLQTLVWKKRLANTLMQARQFITHGHILVGGKKVTSPSYIVLRSEDDAVAFMPESTLNSIFKFTEKQQKRKSHKFNRPDRRETQSPAPVIKAEVPEVAEILEKTE